MTTSLAQTPTYHAIVAELQRYYAINDCANDALASWMTATFSPSCVLALVDELLANPTLLAEVAARSYHHGNGFLKVVIAAQNGWKLRLHVWFPNTPCEENIHDHR